MFADRVGAWWVVVRYRRMVIKWRKERSLAASPAREQHGHSIPMSSRDTRTAHLLLPFHQLFSVSLARSRQPFFGLLQFAFDYKVLHLLLSPQLLCPLADKSVHVRPKLPREAPHHAWSNQPSSRMFFDLSNSCQDIIHFYTSLL